MQLACAVEPERDFLDGKCTRADLRWLFLQTENSCRRLKYDLKPDALAHLRTDEQASD